jgi:hypothetical protein
VFSPHMLILAAHVLLHVTLTPTIGAPQHISAFERDMAVCKMIGAEIVASAPDDDVLWTCTSQFGT